jgi:fructose-1,6-bisphosphatase I
MIADIHRTLLKGGIYMYPKSSIATEGKLRLAYECNPMAFLVEQAGGLATDGQNAILDIQPEHIHQRTPFFAGSKMMVKQAIDMLQ